MTSDEPRDGRCGAKCSSGGYCENYPVGGSDRCRMHGGTSTGPKTEEGKETVSGNAITHGVTADPLNLYSHLSDDEAEWIDDLADGYREVLGYDENDPRMERVTRACIHIFQANNGEGQILEDGLSESQTIGVSDETGKPIVRDSGHHLNKTVLKRDKEARQILRTLGAFDDPESQKAEGMQDLAAVIEKNQG